MSGRWVEIDGMHNVRDLGGVEVEGGSTARGVVLRGETVVHLTPLGAAQLRALGVRHILDLREPVERTVDGYGVLADAVEHCELVHEAVPLALGGVTTDPVGRTHDPMVVADRYWSYLDTGSFRLAEALSRVAWSTSPTYVHCAVGKDRTGVVSALLLSLAGAPDEGVVADHLLTGERLEPIIRRLGTRPAYPHLSDPDWDAQQPTADAMRLFLDRLHAHGGARGWLLHHGADPETVDLLTARLRGHGAVAVRAAG
jgi:hypothetical protein